MSGAIHYSGRPRRSISQILSVLMKLALHPPTNPYSTKLHNVHCTECYIGLSTEHSTTHQPIPHQIAHSVHCTALNAALHWPLHCTGDYIASNLILHWLLHCTKGCTLKSTALYWWPLHCTEGCTEVGTALHTATSYRLYTKTTKSILLTVRWNRHCIVRHNSHSSWKTSYIVTMSSHDTKDNNLHTIQYIWYSIQNFCSYATREM